MILVLYELWEAAAAVKLAGNHLQIWLAELDVDIKGRR